MVAHDPVESDADDVTVAHPAAVVAHHAGHGALGDRHEPQIGVAGRRGEGHIEGHPVEFGADRIGHHRRRLGEDSALFSDALGQTRGLGIAGEPHGGLGAGRLVGRAVHRFGDADLVDPLAGTREHHRDHIGHAGVRPVAEDSGMASRTRGSDSHQVVRALLAAGDPGGRRAHVDTRFQQPFEFVDTGPQRVVAARVGLGRQ